MAATVAGRVNNSRAARSSEPFQIHSIIASVPWPGTPRCSTANGQIGIHATRLTPALAAKSTGR